jgi:hypothetical protein
MKMEVLELNISQEMVNDLEKLVTGIRTFRAGDGWCVLYEDGLQGDVLGFGPTLRLAVHDLYNNFADEQERKRKVDT